MPVIEVLNRRMPVVELSNCRIVELSIARCQIVESLNARCRIVELSNSRKKLTKTKTKIKWFGGSPNLIDQVTRSTRSTRLYCILFAQTNMQDYKNNHTQ